MGLFGDVGKALGIGKGGGTLLGGIAGFALGGPMGAAIGAGIGGGLDSQQAQADQAKAAAKSGGGNAAAAYQAQVQAALASADAAKYTADKQYALGQAQIDAGIQSSKMSAIGGIIAGAMAGQQDQTVRKQLLPHEAGSATIMSHDLAERWNKTLAMRTAGYQDVAIQHELQGRSWKAKWDDATYNALEFAQGVKKDNLANVQLFGIKSDKNPHGIDIPEEEWYAMHTFKDPKTMMEVDPQEAAARNQAYAKWKEDMYKSGNDLIVQMYENPQLAGNNIMTMRGKDALIDERLAPLVKAMNGEQTSKLTAQMQAELDAIDKGAPQWRATEGNSPGMGFYFDAKGNMIKDGKDGGRTITARDSYNFAMDKINKEKDAVRRRYAAQINQAGKDKGIWDQAIDAATKGEQNKYTEQIKKLQKEGVIDQYGMINAGALNKMIPPELTAAPNYKMQHELTPEEKTKLKDEYMRLSSMKVDEKLVRMESMGGGITRKILLNKDGTRAASVMEGYIMDKTGQQHFVSMAGDRAQDFMDKASAFQGFSPLSPGYRAAISNDEFSGKTVKSSTWNYMAKPDTRGSATKAPTPSAPKAPPKLQAVPDPLGKRSGAAPLNSAAPAPKANPAAAVGGAPLAAGE